MYAQMYKQTGLWYLIEKKYNLAVGIFLTKDALQKYLNDKNLKNVKILDEAA